jgi:ATP-dependent DNA helicase RecQ
MGGDVSLIRGDLLRENLNLRVVKADSEDAKMAWLYEFLSAQEGTGLIYTGRRADTDLYASWLKHVGISATNYNAGLDRELRKEIEEGLRSDRWKCIVSTNALGMGIDKPDIRFIIHIQMPASPIHYYQEMGRAGRDGLPTEIVLLYNPIDRDLPEYFIKKNRPTINQYQKVLKALKQESLDEYDLAKRTNLTRTQIGVICADLIDQGIIQESAHGNRKYEYQSNAPLLDIRPFETLRRFKFQELRKMIQYAESPKCRMDYLCAYLGDTSVGRCGKCDNDLNHHHQVTITGEYRERIQDFWDTYFPELKVGSPSSNLMDGVASSYYGSSDVGATIHRCKYENGGYFPDYLLIKTLRAYRKHFGQEEFDVVVYVPPTESGDLVENFAKRVAKNLHFPISDSLKKVRVTEPQKVFQNDVLKRDNVKEAFYYENPLEVRGKSILVVDDIFDSGSTIKEVGRMLIELGAAKIAPLTIAKTIGGTSS